VRPVRYRCTLGRPAWAGGLGRRGGLLTFAPGRIRVEAVVAGQVAPSVRDLRQNAGHELHRVHPLAFGRLDVAMPSLVQVDDLRRAGREAEPGEAHRGAHHAADQRLETLTIPCRHIGAVVHGEAASPPRQRELNPLLAQQPFSTEDTSAI
jgi:hypothetical protein